MTFASHNAIALDDFGAGFSWLRRLHELPVDVLKLDATVTHAEPDVHLQSLCQVLMTLGRKMRPAVAGAESLVSSVRLGCNDIGKWGRDAQG